MDQERVRPARCTEGELAEVGVRLLNSENTLLQCDRCGQKWSPDLLPGGRLPARYWHCPNGCNAPGKA